MARTKHIPIDTRPASQPALLPTAGSLPADNPPTVAPSGLLKYIAVNLICHKCNFDMTGISMEDFDSHVASCPGTGTGTGNINGNISGDGNPVPASQPGDSSSSFLTTSSPESLLVDHVSNALTQDNEHVSGSPKDLPLDPEPPIDAGHQPETEEVWEIADDDDSDSISAYCWNEVVYYESAEEEDASAVEAISRRSSVSISRKNSAKNSAKSSTKSSAKSSAAPTPEAEEPQTSLDPNGTQSSQASQNGKAIRYSQPLTDVDEPQPSQVSEVPEVLVTEPFTNSKTPKTWKDMPEHPESQGHNHARSGSIPTKSARSGSIPKTVDSGSIPMSARSDAVPKVTPMRPCEKKVRAKQSFRKLTAMEYFEAYLANPEDMSYEQLYYKTGFVAEALMKLQEEYDSLDKKTDDYDNAKKHKAKIVAEAKKEQDDKDAAETDAILLQLHTQYREEVKQPLKDYNTWLEQLQAVSNPNITPLFHWDHMKQIKNPEVMSKVHKRRKQLEKQEAKPTSFLEDAPLPALRKGDEEVRKKRNLLQDPVVFEDRKTADVYMIDYSKHKDAVGYQVLKDRHAVAPVEEKDENGRPKRSRGKRAYDTEPTNTPGGSDSEEAPLGKRRRTARVVQDLPTSPARRRTATREGSPKVSVFPKSGKRIGRPPKAKADVLPPVAKSASKSKLQQSHLPPVSEPAQSADSDDELANPQTPRELEPIEQAQLHEAAEALVQQTQSANAPPAKPKQAGSRPKKTTLILNVRSEDETPEVKASPKKGGRAPAKPKAARAGRVEKEVVAPVEPVQIAEENDVIQSTEHDDESRFASASTSRPTTSSSAMTTTTGRASRAASRAASRELSAQATMLGGPVGAQASTGIGRGGKRQRAGVENETSELAKPTGPAPKKRKTAAKKQETIPEEDEERPVTPDATDKVVAESSATTSGRPKRKKASALPGPAYLPLLEDFAQADESEAPPQKRRKSGKTSRPARKVRAVKQEATESAFFSEAAEDVQPKPKKHMIRFDNTRKFAVPEGYRANVNFKSSAEPALKQSESRSVKGKGKQIEIQEYTPEDAGGNSSAANGSGMTPRDSENLSGLQTGDDTDGFSMKSKSFSTIGKGKAPSYIPNFESGAELSGQDGDGEDGDNPAAAAEEEARKRAQKSRKLARATKERWAKGLMKGPMEKRAATNAAKRAAKDAAKGGQSNGVPASSFTPNPFFTAPPNPLLPMVFDNQPVFSAAPQNPFSNPTGHPPEMFAALDAIAYVGAPLPPTTFIPVTTGPTNVAAPNSKAALAKNRKPAAQKTNANITASASFSQDPPAEAITTSNASASATANSTSAPTSAPAPTRGSTRVRKPSRLAMGMDGAGDEEEPQHQFRSEYERYQALTSPRSPLTLGKRKRKSLMDLSAIRDEDDDSF